MTLDFFFFFVCIADRVEFFSHFFTLMLPPASAL